MFFIKLPLLEGLMMFGKVVASHIKLQVIIMITDCRSNCKSETLQFTTQWIS